MKLSQSTRTSLLSWLDTFASCVTARDLNSAKALFTTNVHSFGTRTIEALNIEELIAEQWEPTWLRTTGFKYLSDSIDIILSADETMAVILARWESQGVDSPTLWDKQTPYYRSGRCTFTLKKSASNIWLCVHTHFSMDPSSNYDLKNANEIIAQSPTTPAFK